MKNLKTGTLSCDWRDVFSNKKTIPSSTLFNTLVSVHRWLSLFNCKCLSHLPLLHSCSSVDHSHIVPVDVMWSIPFKDMLSDGRFLWMIEPNCIPMFLRSYFQSSHRLPHVLVLTGLAFYWIHNIPLCSTRQSVLYIVQAIEGLGLVERASDSSFLGNSSYLIAHSLNERNAF